MSKLSTASRFSPIFRTSGSIRKGARAGAVAIVLVVALLSLLEAWAVGLGRIGTIRGTDTYHSSYIRQKLRLRAGASQEWWQGHATSVLKPQSVTLAPPPKSQLWEPENQTGAIAFQDVTQDPRKGSFNTSRSPEKLSLAYLPYDLRFYNFSQILTLNETPETRNSRLREEMTRTLNDSLSPKLAELLRKDPHWRSDLRDTKLTADMGEATDRLTLLGSRIDTSDVTVRARKPLVVVGHPTLFADRRDTGIIPLSPEDQSLVRSYYRYCAIRYVAQALSGIESKQTYSSAHEFAADARSQLRQPGVRERPEPVTDLDTELVARARQVTYRLDSIGNQDRLHLEDSDYRPGDDLSGVRFYEAEVTFSLPDIGNDLIAERNGKIVGNYNRAYPAAPSAPAP